MSSVIGALTESITLWAPSLLALGTLWWVCRAIGFEKETQSLACEAPPIRPEYPRALTYEEEQVLARTPEISGDAVLSEEDRAEIRAFVQGGDSTQAPRAGQANALAEPEGLDDKGIPYHPKRHWSPFDGAFTIPLPGRGWWVGSWRFPRFEARLFDRYMEDVNAREDWKSTHPAGCVDPDFETILPGNLEEAWPYYEECLVAGKTEVDPPEPLMIAPISPPETDPQSGRDMSGMIDLIAQVRSNEARRRMLARTMAVAVHHNNHFQLARWTVDQNVELGGVMVHFMLVGARGVILVNATGGYALQKEIARMAPARKALEPYLPDGVPVNTMLVYTNDAMMDRDPWLYRDGQGGTCWVLGRLRLRDLIMSLNPSGGLTDPELYRANFGNSISEWYLHHQREDVATSRARADELSPAYLDPGSDGNADPIIDTSPQAKGLLDPRMREILDGLQDPPTSSS